MNIVRMQNITIDTTHTKVVLYGCDYGKTFVALYIKFYGRNSLIIFQ